uniref:Uncharacterized protein n=1 Tax=Romanomermis culicivorax TaxID=13658 RepID=A0A915I0A8_ROMCU
AFYEHAYAGTYYPFKNSPYEQKQEIEKYHHHPDFEDVNVTTTDLQELFMRYPDFEREWKTQLPSRRQFFFNDWLQKVEGPEIMELADDIFFDANVQPLPLESDQPIIFDGMGLFTVDWDQKS